MSAPEKTPVPIVTGEHRDLLMKLVQADEAMVKELVKNRKLRAEIEELKEKLRSYGHNI